MEKADFVEAKIGIGFAAEKFFQYFFEADRSIRFPLFAICEESIFATARAESARGKWKAKRKLVSAKALTVAAGAAILRTPRPQTPGC